MNIGIITQARMTSERLPGKILKKIKNKPLLSYHTQRLGSSGLPLFIATTINKTDDSIIDFCLENKISFLRGDEQNVLSRFYECAVSYNLDTIVRVTSDCPLIDGSLIRNAINQYKNFPGNNVYYSNCIERTFPRGFDFEIFTLTMLKDAFQHAHSPLQKEHVTPYFYQNTDNKFILQHFKTSENNSNYRITVDTPEDFELIKKLIEEFNCDTKNAAEIIEILKKNPSLSEINKHIEQKKT